MTLRLNGSTSGYTEIDAPAVAGSNTLVLPTGNGSSQQVLATNGSGALSWSNRPILQVVQASYTTSSSTVSVIPIDSTIPQNTEGTEILSASITPASSSNKLLIEVSVPFVDSDAPCAIYVALFQDSIANALAGGISVTAAASYSEAICFTHYMTAGTASSTTFKVRYGPNAGTAYINRRASGETYGGVCAARLVITEIAA